MIGTKYTPELLAALAKTPLMARLDVAVPPVGDNPEEIDSYTVRYSDNGVTEYGFVEYVEETYSAADKITSLYGGMDDADPWLVIVEPD